MINKKRVVIIAALLLLFSLSGCIGVKRSFKSVRNGVLRSVDADFSKEMEFRINSGLMALASTIVSVTNTPPEVKKMVSAMNSMQIGIYNLGSRNEESVSNEFFKSIGDRMDSAGWDKLVRTREDGKFVGVFIKKSDSYKLRQMFVIALEDKQLVMVDLRGRLDDVLTLALKYRDEGMKMGKKVHYEHSKEMKKIKTIKNIE